MPSPLGRALETGWDAADAAVEALEDEALANLFGDDDSDDDDGNSDGSSSGGDDDEETLIAADGSQTDSSSSSSSSSQSRRTSSVSSQLLPDMADELDDAPDANLGEDESAAEGALRGVAALHALLVDGAPSGTGAWVPALWLLAEIRLFSPRPPPAAFAALPPVTLRSDAWPPGDLRRRCLAPLAAAAVPAAAALAATHASHAPDAAVLVQRLAGVAAGGRVAVVPPLTLSFAASGDAWVAATLAVCLAQRQLEAVTIAAGRDSDGNGGSVADRHGTLANGGADLGPGFEATDDADYGEAVAAVMRDAPVTNLGDAAYAPPPGRTPPPVVRTSGEPTIGVPMSDVPLPPYFAAAPGFFIDAHHLPAATGGTHAATVVVATRGWATLALSHLGRLRTESAAFARALLPALCGGGAEGGGALACDRLLAALLVDVAAEGAASEAGGSAVALPGVPPNSWQDAAATAWRGLPELADALFAPRAAATQQNTQQPAAALPALPAAALFVSDAAAEAALQTAAVAGDELATVAVVRRVTAAAGGALEDGTLEGEMRCVRLLSLAFPMAKDAAHSSGGADGMPHVPALWEAHEDSAVMEDAVEEAMNLGMLRALAAAGDVGANMQLGELELHGYPQAGVAQDGEAARAHFAAAAAGGDPNGMVRVTMLAVEAANEAGDDSPARAALNGTAAVATLEAAAEAGSLEAMAALGYLHQSGALGIVPRNLTAALAYLTAAAAGGHQQAASNLAAMYLADEAERAAWGIPFNASLARRYLDLAAAAGSLPAVFNLGVMEFHGWDREGGSNCTAALAHWASLAVHGRWRHSTLLTEAAAFRALSPGDDGTEPPVGALETALRLHLVMAAAGSSHAMDDAAWLLRRLPSAAWVADTAAAVAAPLNASAVDQLVPSGDCGGADGGTSHPALPAPAGMPPYDDDGGGCVRGVAAAPVPDALAAQLLAVSAAGGSAYAAATLADCYATGWRGVQFCQRGDAAATATAWYTTASDAGYAHASFELAQAALGGRLGVHTHPANASHAWLLLDAVAATDYLGVVAAAIGRMQVLAALPWRSLVAAATDCAAVWEAGDAAGGGDDAQSWLDAWLDRILDDFEDDEGGGAAHAARWAGHDPDVAARAARYWVGGVLPLTLDDRQLCSVVARTAAALAAAGGVALVAALLFWVCTRPTAAAGAAAARHRHAVPGAAAAAAAA